MSEDLDFAYRKWLRRVTASDTSDWRVERSLAALSESGDFLTRRRRMTRHFAGLARAHWLRPAGTTPMPRSIRPSTCSDRPVASPPSSDRRDRAAPIHPAVPLGARGSVGRGGPEGFGRGSRQLNCVARRLSRKRYGDQLPVRLLQPYSPLSYQSRSRGGCHNAIRRWHLEQRNRLIRTRNSVARAYWKRVVRARCIW